VSYRMNGFCINQPFTGMQPLVDSIFNSDIHNNGDLNEELWCSLPPIAASSPPLFFTLFFPLMLQLLRSGCLCQAFQWEGHVSVGLCCSSRQTRCYHGQRSRAQQQFFLAFIAPFDGPEPPTLISRQQQQNQQPCPPRAVCKCFVFRPQRTQRLKCNVLSSIIIM
jgi:hypothetical protein